MCRMHLVYKDQNGSLVFASLPIKIGWQDAFLPRLVSIIFRPDLEFKGHQFSLEAENHETDSLVYFHTPPQSCAGQIHLF